MLLVCRQSSLRLSLTTNEQGGNGEGAGEDENGTHCVRGSRRSEKGTEEKERDGLFTEPELANIAGRAEK